MKKIVIAIDGPAGAGKSSVAKALATKLDYLYIDTGAMYRAITWGILEENIDWHDEACLRAFLEKFHLEMTWGKNGCSIAVNGKDVTTLIRSFRVSEKVSTIAAIRTVREYLRERQQTLAKVGGVILDGRDIGSVVFPNAELKIFLTASVESRVARRWAELRERDGISIDDIRQNIISRDFQDKTRQESPLVCVTDAVVVDSSNMSFDETVAHIWALAKERMTQDDE